MSAASLRITASSASTAKKPMATVNGSLSAAISGGSTALRTPTMAATATAPPKPLSSAPGTTAAASISPSADPSQAMTRRTGCRRGRSGLQTGTLARRLSGCEGRAAPGSPRVNQSESRANTPTAPIARFSPASWASP